MKSFNEWKMAENYNQSLDGSPLDPDTLLQAKTQIRTLARNIRGFMFNPQFAQYDKIILAATQQLDAAANALSKIEDTGQSRQFSSPK